ncbi:MAG: DUF559 domain-containing protein [Desulfitobacterium sp.]
MLEYADNPQAYSRLAEAVEAKADSPFEETVGKSLVAAGYHITQQWEVGAYRIDMVVQYNGKKIAVECDGEQYHSGEEKVRADMERQTILERMGWRFIRIRGSEYYRDSEATMVRVINELTNYGILQESMIEPIANITSSELLSRVKIRAMQIMDEWHSGDEDTVEDGDDSKNKMLPITTASPHVLRPESIKREEKTIAPKQTEDFVQVSIDQHETSTSEKPPDSLLKRSNVVSRSRVTQNKSTPDTAKMNNVGRTNAQRAFTKLGEDILHRLKQEHIHCIDKREQSGIIWVLFSSAVKENFENIASNSGYRFSFEPRGSSSTGNKPAWRIMVT